MPKTLVQELVDFIFPKTCTYCNLYVGKDICDECRKSLIQYEAENFVTRKRSSNWEMSLKEKEFSGFEKVFYFYHYNKVIHNLIEDIKYNFHKNKIETALELFFEASEFNKINFEDFDLFTYVPLSKKRENWRGFNHSKLIVEGLARKFNKPFCQILIKTKNTKSQIDLTRVERLENLKQVFEVKNDLPIELKDQRIFLIDDICSTGSTLIEAAKTIKAKFPGIKIYGMTLARGEK